MLTIYKYPIEINDEVFLDLPAGAEILTVQMQGAIACAWAKVDTANPTERRVIHIRGTGHEASDLGRYISTFQIMNGALVFHAFEGPDHAG